MSFFGSLYASTSGMMAASKATQVTSQNVANMSTVGYKKSDTSFSDIVANSLYSPTSGNSGGVASTKLLRASQQGTMQQTGAKLDAGIVGRGFFAMQKTNDASGDFYYTRNGQFGEAVDPTSGSTFLKNSAGFYLYGWEVDTNGVAAGGTTTGSLVPIDLSDFDTQVQATSRIDLGINLDAAEENYNPHRLGQTLPIGTGESSNFTRSVTIYDTLGTPRDVEFQFRKITGPMAQFVTGKGNSFDYDDVLVDNLTGPTPGIVNGDTMTIANGSESLNITFVNGTPAAPNEVNSMRDLVNTINNFTDIGGVQQFEARLDERGQLLVTSALPAETLDVTASGVNVTNSTGLDITVDPVDGDYSYDPFYDITAPADPAGPYPDQDSFPALTNTVDPNSQGWWEMTVLIPDPAAPNGTTKTTLRQGMINFDGLGALNADTAPTGGSLLDLGTAINFDNSQTGEESALTVDISQFSQFSNAYNVIQAGQNGAGQGQRNGVYIDNDGYVMAEYDNGIEIPMYQIPLANFANIDGLTESSGTVFKESVLSGAVSMYAAGNGGTGKINGSALEGSNVDISEEFGDLIVHQRMFGLNSKVINAVDEMTQNLVRLKQ
ncbi:MAG: hypothetical protein CMH27_10635 [Micavibrio sp.]|nr:hypothetical protein [Micavibrio sp.]